MVHILVPELVPQKGVGFMRQAKFSLKDDQIAFLGQYASYGFKDKSSMVRAALQLLRKTLELQGLKASAKIYAEIADDELDLPDLSHDEMAGWLQ